ncbi:MAG: DNA-binding transcriptional LysR family regulator [Gammaproteobacteria bacterium]|jgi:DNA-binding transcriptional LysR family regulator
MARNYNVSLSRREADISIRLDDKRPVLKLETEQIEAKKIGTLYYAVYSSIHKESSKLPWAGLMKGHVRTSGSLVMTDLAGEMGIQYRVHHFDALLNLVKGGAARAMLPCFMGDNCKGLKRLGEAVLFQPIWMLYHQQDKDVHHLVVARNWIRKLAMIHFKSA